ncbi:MAG: CPXCG motif-containing cysteine-rich protein [bacterium]
MNPIEHTTIQCPYCAEIIAIALDSSAGIQQSYIEDCQVCCQPIEFRIDLRREPPEVMVSAQGQ